MYIRIARINTFLNLHQRLRCFRNKKSVHNFGNLISGGVRSLPTVLGWRMRAGDTFSKIRYKLAVKSRSITVISVGYLVYKWENTRNGTVLSFSTVVISFKFFIYARNWRTHKELGYNFRNVLLLVRINQPEYYRFI